ncbi:SOS response-associated peptidase family protein [Spongiimicrobium salis]|uniref:SOS response-associated peptidase family protein n=1 Tax=Spongiimicrobium salis TaxID=1667022 RepID=UPI00374C9778
MKCKISNTAPKEVLENFTGIPLKYPKLYGTNPLISGFEETIVPLIVQEDTSKIVYGIWGLLPENYEGNWESFQNIMDTLTIDITKVQDNALYAESYNLKRCTVVVTGFFTTYYHQGKTYPYHVYNANKEPLYLAAYYNRLNDGFITFSIALQKVDPAIKKIQNLSEYSPKILSPAQKNRWLSLDISDMELEILIHEEAKITLDFHPVARELYNMGITYDSMLEPVHYDGIPNL